MLRVWAATHRHARPPRAWNAHSAPLTSLLVLALHS
jgi:hypothetical protein